MGPIMQEQTLPGFTPVSELSTEARAKFISNTYGHVAAAILLFTTIEMWLFSTGRIVGLSQWIMSFNWLIIIGALMLVSWGATHVAHKVESKPLQYLALAAFVIMEAIIFAPLLLIAANIAPGIIESAVGITLLGVGGLTAVAFITRKDFSFMRGILMWAGILAMVAIVGSVLFGFQLGTWFSVAMIGFAGGAVLYDTSNIIHHYPEDKYVGAALALFSSIALMFWYVLRLLISSRD
jgi:FtsH-binding integral membrane protein